MVRLPIELRRKSLLAGRTCFSEIVRICYLNCCFVFLVNYFSIVTSVAHELHEITGTLGYVAHWSGLRGYIGKLSESIH